jgi:hypothetical protein
MSLSWLFAGGRAETWRFGTWLIPAHREWKAETWENFAISRNQLKIFALST